MDRVAFDGVEYVKAAVAAKQFGYTSDYIGQLCRSKKINARLVGRTWFVNIDSIQEHRKNKHKKTSDKKSKVSGIPIKTKSSRKVVPPVLKSKTAQTVVGSEQSVNAERTLKVSYDRDEESLLPSLIKKKLPTPKTIRVDQAGSEKIRVIGCNATKTSFLAEKLPDVALSGDLSIKDYPDLPKPEGDILVDEDDVVEKPSGDTNVVSEKPIESASLVEETPEAAKLVLKMASAASMIKKTSVPVLTANPTASTQVTALSQFTPAAVQVKGIKTSSPWVTLSPLIVTFVAIAISAAIWSASSIIVASNSFYQSDIVFQSANLFEILSI